MVGKVMANVRAAWEPKVAKLEATIESVTRNVDTLTAAVQGLSRTVQDLAKNTSDQFEKLLVAVTVASGPKSTNWQVIVAGCLLVLTLGAAVLSPIEQRLTGLHNDSTITRERLDSHLLLPMHAVGQARIDGLETNIHNQITEITRELERVRAEGTPATNQRLAAIESRLGRIDREKDTQ